MLQFASLQQNGVDYICIGYEESGSLLIEPADVFLRLRGFVSVNDYEI